MRFFEGPPDVDAACHFCGEAQPFDHEHCCQCGESMDPFAVAPKAVSETLAVFRFRIKGEDLRGAEKRLDLFDDDDDD